MDVRVFMPGEADVPEFAHFLRLDQHGVGAFFVENAMRVLIPDDLMVLDQVDAVGLQPPERFLELSGGRLSGAAIYFGHHLDPPSVGHSYRRGDNN